MKKLMLLTFVLSLSFTSCGSDDGGGSSGGDAFVGTWKLSQSFSNGTQETLDACDLMETVIVKSDGTFTSESFEDNGSGGCNSDGANPGQWENLGNNSYRITSDVGTPDENTFTATITFQNNTFQLDATQGSDTFKVIYTRQ